MGVLKICFWLRFLEERELNDREVMRSSHQAIVSDETQIEVCETQKVLNLFVT